MRKRDYSAECAQNFGVTVSTSIRICTVRMLEDFSILKQMSEGAINPYYNAAAFTRSGFYAQEKYNTQRHYAAKYLDHRFGGFDGLLCGSGSRNEGL